MASMASRPLQTSADIPGHSSQASFPPSISSSSKLLSSIISLPVHPSIAYAMYIPVAVSDSPPEERIELARRRLVTRNKCAQASILESFLPCVRVGKDSKCLYIFRITSHDQTAESQGKISGLQFDGLICECSHLFFILPFI